MREAKKFKAGNNNQVIKDLAFYGSQQKKQTTYKVIFDLLLLL